MDRRQISALLVLDALGVPPKMEMLSDRLFVQNAIYLARTCGLNLGYSFGRCLQGRPYSVALTHDLFSAIEGDQAPRALQRYNLDNERLRLLDPLVQLTSGMNDSERSVCLRTLVLLFIKGN